MIVVSKWLRRISLQGLGFLQQNWVGHLNTIFAPRREGEGFGETNLQKFTYQGGMLKLLIDICIIVT